MSSPMMNSNAMSYYKREDGEECYTYISYGLKNCGVDMWQLLRPKDQYMYFIIFEFDVTTTCEIVLLI